jgi:hypothetical protein
VVVQPLSSFEAPIAKKAIPNARLDLDTGMWSSIGRDDFRQLLRRIATPLRSRECEDVVKLRGVGIKRGVEGRGGGLFGFGSALKGFAGLKTRD